MKQENFVFNRHIARRQRHQCRRRESCKEERDYEINTGAGQDGHARDSRSRSPLYVNASIGSVGVSSYLLCNKLTRFFFFFGKEYEQARRVHEGYRLKKKIRKNRWDFPLEVFFPGHVTKRDSHHNSGVCPALPHFSFNMFGVLFARCWLRSWWAAAAVGGVGSRVFSSLYFLFVIPWYYKAT